MSKINKDLIATGAKRIVATTTLTAMLFAGIPTVAYASVPATNVIGDLQTTEDRTEVKRQDGKRLDNKFNTGCVALSEIEKAICLSNLLNGYYFDVINYTNTNVNEMVNLDVNGMYDRYVWNSVYGNVNNFCSDSLYYKPACDGFITLSSKTVANEIRNSIIARVRNSYISQGRKVTGTPQVVINGNELAVIIKVDGKLKKVVMTGDNVLNVITTINGLDYLYNTAMLNVTGKDMANDGTFMYNGIDYFTGESVYLSLPDDNKKTTIQGGIDLARLIAFSENYQFGLNIGYSETLSKAEKDALIKMGYSRDSVKNARREFINMMPVVIKTLNKNSL